LLYSGVSRSNFSKSLTSIFLSTRSFKPMSVEIIEGGLIELYSEKKPTCQDSPIFFKSFGLTGY
jgi:hypothetical protein